MKHSYHFIQACFGGAGGLLLVIVPSKLVPDYAMFSDQRIDERTEQVTVARKDRHGHETAGPMAITYTDLDLHVEYPTSITEDSTREVEVNLRFEEVSVLIDTSMSSPTEPVIDVFWTPVGRIVHRIATDQLPRETSLNLSGPAFSITDHKKVIPSGTPTPHRIVWLITPQKRGSHLLTLDLADFMEIGGDQGVGSTALSSAVTMNGQSAAVSDAKVLTLPIAVYTIWGISEKTFTIIKWAIAIVVFLLMFPLLHDLVRYYLKRQRPEDKPKKAPEVENVRSPDATPAPKTTIAENATDSKRRDVGDSIAGRGDENVDA